FKAYYGGTLARDATGTLQNPADVAMVELDVDRFAMLLDQYVNADAPQLNWDTAAQKVIDGTAAMFPHGDWAKGLYVQEGKTPGVDFDVFSPPGDPQKTFLYGVDGFSMATLGKNLPAGIEFLDTFLSEAGQLAFCKIKGASTVRKNVSLGTLDTIAQKNAQAISDATVTMQDPGEGWGYVDAVTANNVTEDAALNAFATTRATDLAALTTLYDFFLTKAHKL
ncbi:MAG TPA: extracellular solute-binding protein, partial [Polyangia bacterium]